MSESAEIDILRMFVEAHDQPHPGMGERIPIMYLKHSGGSSVQHHALEEIPPGIDEALLEEMQAKRLISIDYREHNWNITPTSYARDVLQEHERVTSNDPIADVGPLADALATQATAKNPMEWSNVRPVLAALRLYWQEGGFSSYGIQLFALANAVPDNHQGLLAATIRGLTAGGYLHEAGSLGVTITDDVGRVTGQLPGEVTITEKAHTILDGWPGVSAEELVENMLAVLSRAAEDEPDPTRKKRLERVVESIREVGVSVTSEVIAKVLTG